MTTSEIIYEGKELEIFENATIWKNYYGSFIKPFLKGKVLEIGAGTGGTTAYLCDGSQEQWLCIEPDPRLFDILVSRLESGTLPGCCSAIKTSAEFLPQSEKFDAIIYIDVIEHIENDKRELDMAKNLLAANGHLIVLSPAHQSLYSPFDKAIGHYRRYNKKMLAAISPLGLKMISVKYLDSMGVFALLINKFILKQNYPTHRQINFWDKVIIRFSKLIDPVVRYRIGKTILVIWKKN